MGISAKAIFLVRNITMGKISYQEAVNSKAVKEEPALKDEMDAYIVQQNLIINKTV